MKKVYWQLNNSPKFYRHVKDIWIRSLCADSIKLFTSLGICSTPKESKYQTFFTIKYCYLMNPSFKVRMILNLCHILQFLGTLFPLKASFNIFYFQNTFQFRSFPKDEEASKILLNPYSSFSRSYYSFPSQQI